MTDDFDYRAYLQTRMRAMVAQYGGLSNQMRWRPVRSWVALHLRVRETAVTVDLFDQFSGEHLADLFELVVSCHSKMM